MDKPELVQMTVKVLPSTKKAYEFLNNRCAIDSFLKEVLEKKIIERLKGNGLNLDVNYAAELLTELDREIYQFIGLPEMARQYRIKNNYLWFLVEQKDGDKYWSTVAAHVYHLTEPCDD